MKNAAKITAILGFAITSISTVASEDGNHFPSLDAPNTTVAVCNLNNYNEKLKTILAKSELSDLDMLKVHELTYTLENAVIRLQKDLENIAVDLEKAHKGSEALKQDVIKQSGTDYLNALNMILSPKAC